MPFQLNANGLQTQTQAEIVDELTQKLRATFGNNLNVSTSSIMGQLVNIFAELRALDQQTALAVYRCFDPNAAIGVCLDRLALLTGSQREGATNSTVDVEFTFTAAGQVNNGDQFRNDDNNTIWEAINGPWVAGGPGVIAGQLQAVDTGPILANAGTTWSLVTANPNLSGVANPADDANPGQNEQSDTSFKQTRSQELFARGQGPLAAITAVVSKVDGVTYAKTYHNPNVNPFDADGIPFKAFNVVVQTTPSPPPVALQQSIWDAIWSVTGAGGEAFGTDYVGSVVDSEGQLQQPIAFDLVSDVTIWIEVEITTSTSENPITPNIEAVCAAAILERANASWKTVGRDVLAFDVVGVINDLVTAGEVSGIDQVAVALDTTAFPGIPGAQKIDIGIREQAVFDSPRIQVVSV